MDDTTSTDIIEVLKSQHTEAKEGLSSVLDAELTVRGGAFQKLAAALAAHEQGGVRNCFRVVSGSGWFSEPFTYLIRCLILEH